MRTEVFYSLPEQAIEIRQNVFIKEQGFKNEFDDIDSVSAHFVLLDNDIPIATCRLFFDKEKNAYVLGRLAVINEKRGQGIGRIIVEEAEKYVLKTGADLLWLHSQCRIRAFYERLGFSAQGEIDYDEGCPHVWMSKNLKSGEKAYGI